MDLKECGPYCACKAIGNCGSHVTSENLNVEVELRWCGVKGWGVFTLRDLKKGEFVSVYMGEYLSKKESDKRRDDELTPINYIVG